MTVASNTNSALCIFQYVSRQVWVIENGVVEMTLREVQVDQLSKQTSPPPGCRRESVSCVYKEIMKLLVNKHGASGHASSF